jgi:hypothetical protein
MALDAGISSKGSPFAPKRASVGYALKDMSKFRSGNKPTAVAQNETLSRFAAQRAIYRQVTVKIRFGA